MSTDSKLEPCVVCKTTLPSRRFSFVSIYDDRWEKTYLVCSAECEEVFKINPLAYELEPPVKWRTKSEV